MASSQRPDKVVHQDYIARIRYSNALPPPPHPPKLLDIPGTGLASGQYTSAGYASRLAREQPLNIEADAELGMPIDLVGIPGIFDGDERAILARPGPHTIHPADRALLKPLTSLGKPNAASGAVSFLRRTEYTSSQNSQHFSSSTSKDLLRVRNDPKRRKANINKDDPINVMRSIIKGFDLAYPHDAYKGEDSTTDLRGAAVSDAEVKAWTQPKHPSKPELKLLESYPVLPDLEAIPTTGFYMVMKFTTNPVAASDTYNESLDSAILQPIQDAETQAEFQQRMAEWDPQSGRPEPIPEYSYNYFIPAETAAVKGIKRKLDVNDPENDDPELYSDDVGDGQRAFKYLRVRTYETQHQHGDQHNLYNDSVALALHDPDTEVGIVTGTKKRLAKGAYFYPVVQRTALRPKRKVGNVGLSSQAEEAKIEELNVTMVDMSDDLQKEYLTKRALFDPTISVDELAG